MMDGSNVNLKKLGGADALMDPPCRKAICYERRLCFHLATAPHSDMEDKWRQT